MKYLDEKKSKDYVGKIVLIGVTYLDYKEHETGQRQWFGTITEVSNTKGIVIQLKNDTEYCALPPDLSALKPAKPGDYHLRSTGEIVRNPDFITTWICKEPPPNEKPKKR